LRKKDDPTLRPTARATQFDERSGFQEKEKGHRSTKQSKKKEGATTSKKKAKVAREKRKRVGGFNNHKGGQNPIKKKKTHSLEREKNQKSDQKTESAKG